MAEHTEKRKDPRFVCEGGVEVREGSSRGFWGTMSDVSMGGCYIQTFSPMPAGTMLHFQIKASGFEIHGVGRVAACHPGVGMAIAFAAIEPPDMMKLEQLIGQLAAADKQQGGGLMITP